jgi:type II secretory pathway pseudopilin PulG
MGNRSYKIKAFSLTEMIVALLVTVIVVGLAFSVLSLVQRQMGQMEANYERGTELNLLRQALWMDFSGHGRITYDGSAQRLHFENGPKGMDYLFEADRVIRERDTFFIKMEEVMFYFDGLGITEGPVDAIGLKGKGTNGGRIFVHKYNTAENYMD